LGKGYPGTTRELFPGEFSLGGLIKKGGVNHMEGGSNRGEGKRRHRFWKKGFFKIPKVCGRGKSFGI